MDYRKVTVDLRESHFIRLKLHCIKHNITMQDFVSACIVGGLIPKPKQKEIDKSK